jgi:hypothetical protein
VELSEVARQRETQTEAAFAAVERARTLREPGEQRRDKNLGNARAIILNSDHDAIA